MGFLSVFSGALFTHLVLFLVAKSQNSCEDIVLSDINQTASLSTLADKYANTSEWYGYRRYCWNVTTREGMQLRAECEYHEAAQPYSIYLVLYAGDFIHYTFDDYLDEYYSPYRNLRIVAYLSDDEGFINCDVQPVLATIESICGPEEITLTDQYLISVSIPGSYIGLTCVWLVTSPPGAITFIDLQSIDLRSYQKIAFGRGHDHTNYSSKVHEIRSSSFENGTSYFLFEEDTWFTFSSSTYRDDSDAPTQEILVRAENYTGEVQCRADQVLCLQDSKCLPLQAVCDGRADCSDYTDEIRDCDYCGTSEMRLRHGEELTIMADFIGVPVPDSYYYRYIGYFAIIPGRSETAPNVTSDGVIITNHTEGVESFVCAWRLTEPEGTRIRAEVLELTGWGARLTVGNGLDPATGASLLVMEIDGRIPLPVEIPSISSGMWLTLEVYSSYGYLRTLKLVFTTYNVTECGEGQFACPSGMDCLENVSHVCDGHRECLASGDELGCGDCQPYEFMCATSKDCVPASQLCNGLANCGDHSDELMCGFCGNETIHLPPNETFLLEFGNFDVPCLWVLVAEPGAQIQASIRQLASCTLTIGAGYDSTSPIRSDVIRNFYSYATAYVPTVTTNTSIMWIKMTCGSSSYNSLQIDIRQYSNIKCSPNQDRCPSGLACIQEMAVCDGRSDCPEYSDEFGCGNCSRSEFACRSGYGCVSSDRICDGWNDCTDYSDEFDCGPCGKTFLDLPLDAPSKIISPGWPQNDYPNNAQCLWLMVAEVGYRIVLAFTEFFLEDRFDYLYCGNGDMFDNAFLEVSGEHYPLHVASKENAMFVKFTSDSSVRRRGFELQVEQKPADEVSCGEGEIACKMENLVCVRNDTSERGRLFCSQDDCGYRVYSISIYAGFRDMVSPGHPDHYPSGIDCVWEIQSAKILVSILEFVTESSRDTVQFMGSTLHGGEAVTFQLDGTTKVRTIAFNSTTVFVHFRTDSTVAYTGFHFRLFRNFSATNETSCPYADLFDCGDGSCVSLDAMCDGFKDCQTDGLDELDCADVHCPDFFHCKNSAECLHWPLVCDGIPDCPNGDDETDLECERRCPDGCSCNVDQGRVRVECKDGWNQSTFADLVKRTELLEISGGNASDLDVGLFKEFSNLKALWIRNNSIDRIEPGTFFGLQNLTFLDVSYNNITTIDANCFLELQELDIMLARDIPLKTVHTNAFDGLKQLKLLVLTRNGNLTDSPVDVKDDALTDLMSLEKLYVNDYRLCCDFVSSIDSFEVSDCQTTEEQPPLNLCGSLMRNHVLRVSMWILGLSALVGNTVVIAWRLCQGREKARGKNTHSFLVLNLAASDLMMGVYMLIIAGADVHFGEEYYRVASEWRSSVVCKIAGVLSVLSSEASVFFVTLISLDSFFSIVFPFSRIRLRGKSATVVVALVWLASVGLSIGPTVFAGSDSEFYGLSDVCIGLPLLTKPESYVIEESDIDNPLGTDTISIPVGQGKQPAWIYSIVLFLGVNLLCFLVVLCCYVGIFVKVKRTVSRVKRTAHRDREIKMAVKMALIVGTDFACWMPVIVMGILSQTGLVDISPDIYAWVVVFILPINSSLNPYLYTLYTTVAAHRHLQSTRTEKSGLKTEMKAKSLETLHSTVSDTKPS